MFKSKDTLNIYKVWFLWASTTLISWLIVRYFGFDNRNLLMQSWNVVLQTLTTLFVNGLMLGALVGLLQFVFLADDLDLTKRWIFMQAISYALGSALGLLGVVVLIWLFNPNLFNQANVIFPFPLALTMLAAGGLVGLIQVITLKGQFKFNFSRATLYLTISSLAWGLAFFSVGYLNKDLSLNIQSGVAGIVVGAITGLGLFLLMKDGDSLQVVSTGNNSTN